jgi:hypothetical protein
LVPSTDPRVARARREARAVVTQSTGDRPNAAAPAVRIAPSELGRMSEYETTRLVISLQIEIQGLRREIEGHKREITDLRKDMRDVRDIANRWRGGVAVIVGIGALLGWLITQVDRIRSWLS